MDHILDTQCSDGDCEDILTKNQLYSIRHEFRIVYVYFFLFIIFSKKAKSHHLRVLLPVFTLCSVHL